MKNPAYWAEMAARQPVACLGSVDGEGYPAIKAMLAPRKMEGLVRIFFSTNTSSQHVGQLRGNPKACVYFFDAQRFEGLLLRGAVEVLTGAEERQALWRAGDELFYPRGVTDEDYCVLRFSTRSARWYANLEKGGFDVAGA